ncbi:hypothetical protein J1614_002475 [Plenodomus biglobosus]|nr:hypothetical protein J1614_002475 [Plenodomus biglobosus]
MNVSPMPLKLSNSFTTTFPIGTVLRSLLILSMVLEVGYPSPSVSTACVHCFPGQHHTKVTDVASHVANLSPLIKGLTTAPTFWSGLVHLRPDQRWDNSALAVVVMFYFACFSLSAPCLINLYQTEHMA